MSPTPVKDAVHSHGKKRVGVIGLLHESNTFLSQPTTLEAFESQTLLAGEPIRERFAQAHHEIGGFFRGLAEEPSIEAVPIFVARTLPSGPIDAPTWSALLRRMFEQLDKARPLDGILVAPHGATVSLSHPDADGHWLTALRNKVGPDVPIIGTIDPHANLSAKMVNACDALTAYRSNPHLDQSERGLEAARLMIRTVKGEIRPVVRAVFPPLAVNIERQLTDEPQWRPVYGLADEQLSRPGVLTNSIVLGFPYADVEEMGSAAIAVTDGDADLAQQLANELGRTLWERREDFVGRMIDVEEALDRSLELTERVCLLDMGDNVGGGSAADGTFLAHALHRRKISDAFVCLYDPEAVRRCQEAGAGATVHLSVGGKTDQQHGPPLEADFHVRSLPDGKFRESQVRHGGFTEFDQGPTAVVETAHGLTVMLTSLRMVPFSLHQLIGCGLDPARFHILVAKGVNAPVAAYREVCPHFIRVNTAGSTCADMKSLTFHRRRKPMFPFETDLEWSPENG